MQTQLDAARDAASRLAKDACQQEIATAAADAASAKCAPASCEQTKCPPVEPCVCEERKAVCEEPTAAVPPLASTPAPSPPPLPSPAMDGEAGLGACMSAVSVLGDPASAAAKWVLTPAGDGLRPPAARTRCSCRIAAASTTVPSSRRIA